MCVYMCIYVLCVDGIDRDGMIGVGVAWIFGNMICNGGKGGYVK